MTHSLPQRILGLKVDKNQHNVFNQREFSSAIIHGVLTQSLSQRILGLKVYKNQHKVFIQREFSSAIIHGVLTQSLSQRILGLKVDENQHNVFNQRERVRERVFLCNYSLSLDSFTFPENIGTEGI